MASSGEIAKRGLAILFEELSGQAHCAARRTEAKNFMHIQFNNYIAGRNVSVSRVEARLLHLRSHLCSEIGAAVLSCGLA